MPNITELDDNSRRFLIALGELSQGDPSVQMDTEAVGAEAGLDREAAGQAAQVLMGWQLADIRTLAGGIGITAAGADAAVQCGARVAGAPSPPPRLGPGPLLEEKSRKALASLLTELKQQTGTLGLTYDDLDELMTDIKTIEVHLTSTRAKTAVLRACLEAVAAVVSQSTNKACLEALRQFLRP